MRTALSPHKRETEAAVRSLAERDHVFSIAMLTTLRPQLRQLLAVDASRWPLIVQIAALFEELSLQILAHQERDDDDLFPALLRGDVTAELARVSRGDHQRIERLLDLLDQAVADAHGPPPASAVRAERLLRGLQTLSHGVRQHLNAEGALLTQSDRYPACRGNEAPSRAGDEHGAAPVVKTRRHASTHSNVRG